jgi:hypothetical protein
VATDEATVQCVDTEGFVEWSKPSEVKLGGRSRGSAVALEHRVGDVTRAVLYPSFGASGAEGESHEGAA